jgi:hypothetical protein
VRGETRENRVYDYNNHWECYSASQMLNESVACDFF